MIKCQKEINFDGMAKFWVKEINNWGYITTA